MKKRTTNAGPKDKEKAIKRAFQEIGLHAGATEKQIKSAYRSLVKTWRPDRFTEGGSQQRAADVKVKKIIAAYKLLTSGSKRRDVPARPDSPASSEPKHSQPSSASSDSTNRKKSRSNVAQRDATGKHEQPPKSGSREGTQPLLPKRENPHYPQHDFRKWEAEFKRKLIGGSNAAKGLKKWIGHLKDRRISTIARVENQLKRSGLDLASIEKFPKPEDAHSDSIRRLWIGSAPNVEERNRAIKLDNQLLKQMEKLADSVDAFTRRFQTRSASFETQDRFFEIPLDGVLKLCVRLSSSMRLTSLLVKRKYIYPIDIADCCMSLVLEMEDSCGLTQRECHGLIRCALLAHGCSPEEATPFEEKHVERGTISAKKEAFREKVLKSAQFLYTQSRRRQPQ